MRAARLFAGIEQIPFAAELGVSRQTVSAWETGRNDVPAWAMIRWAELTRVKLEWLGFGSVRPEGFEPPAYCSVADDLTSSKCFWDDHEFCELEGCACECHNGHHFDVEQRDLVLAA